MWDPSGTRSSGVPIVGAAVGPRTCLLRAVLKASRRAALSKGLASKWMNPTLLYLAHMMEWSRVTMTGSPPYTRDTHTADTVAPLHAHCLIRGGGVGGHGHQGRQWRGTVCEGLP